VIIIAVTESFNLFLRRIGQPRVNSEVICGIILGPSVLGRVPAFKLHVFPGPEGQLTILHITSSIGLALFLFLMGLELDVTVVKRNFRVAMLISLAGLLLPMGVGAAVGIGIYPYLAEANIVNLNYFVLFSSIAFGATAFPVLCRILTELNLLETPVGIAALSAGVVSNIIGWILLAIPVALVNATPSPAKGATAVYILLACSAYLLFLLFPGRWAYVWMARRSGSLEQGSPTPGMMTITLFLVMISCVLYGRH
jgi:Kef-type K+ transport system membrane component KefB